MSLTFHGTVICFDVLKQVAKALEKKPVERFIYHVKFNIIFGTK